MRFNTSRAPAFVVVALFFVKPAMAASRDTKGLELEQFLEIDTASRRLEPYLTAPNAVHVLTGEEIRRAGLIVSSGLLRLAQEP